MQTVAWEWPSVHVFMCLIEKTSKVVNIPDTFLARGTSHPFNHCQYVASSCAEISALSKL